MNGQLGAIGELWTAIRKTFHETMISPGTTNEMGTSEFMGYTWIKSLQNKYRTNKESKVLERAFMCFSFWSYCSVVCVYGLGD